MNHPITQGFEGQVLQMAQELGWGCRVEDGAILLEAPTSDGDTVPVRVRPVGDFEGDEVLEFSSDALTLPTDDSAKMPLLILALQRNADVLLGHWGLEETEGRSTLRVFHSQIEKTMDLPEFQGAAMAVADEFAKLAGAFGDVLVRDRQ